MKKILILLFLPLVLQAQPYLDVASAYFQYSAADKPHHNNTVYTELASVSLSVPLKIKNDYIVVSPAYESFEMTFPASFLDRQFHVGILPISWLHQWNTSKWKTALAFIPRFSSTLDDGISYRDVQYGGAILNSYEQKETLKLKFGLYYNSEFFRPFFMPLLGVDWNISTKWNLFGVLPGSMNLEYKFHKSVHAGLMFRSLTNSYRTTGYYFIRVNDNHLKFFLDFYPYKKHVISVEAGHTLFRKFKNGYRITGQPDYYGMNVTDGWLFRIAYAYRIRFDASPRK